MPKKRKQKRKSVDPKTIKKTPRHKRGGKERESVMENLSALVSSGVPIGDALSVLAEESRSKALREQLEIMSTRINEGSPLWKACDEVGIFSAHAISLIRIGEETGRLVENLKIVAVQEHKERVLRSKVVTAMMYPTFVLGLTTLIALGIAWFILPRLAGVFSRLGVDLPWITQGLINTGVFLEGYGIYVIPGLLLVIGIVFYFLFLSRKTRYIGRRFIFALPGVGDLMREAEISRFGFLLGTLLDVGLPITQALDSVSQATQFEMYRVFYLDMMHNIEKGLSVRSAFKKTPKSYKLIPRPTQQIIFSAEQSGNLPGALLAIGERSEERTDTIAKNLTVILEPVLLVIVWVGVIGVALAVILPIYQLVGNFS